MKRPNFEEDGYDIHSEGAYIEKLEEYCDYIESVIKTQVERTDYWCTKANELKTLNSEYVKEMARLRRERG